MKYQRNTLLLFLLSINIVFYCNGQTALIGDRHYTIEDGLSHSQILSVHKDTKGMVWVLAHDKINRFDGKDFKGIYQSRIFNPSARIIGEDSTGDLWIKNAFEKYEPLFFNTAQQTCRLLAFAYNAYQDARWSRHLHSECKYCEKSLGKLYY